MKTKFVFLLLAGILMAVSSFAQTQTFPSDVKIGGKLVMGDFPLSYNAENAKLKLYQNNTSLAGSVYGLYAFQISAHTSANLYGGYFSTNNTSTTSTGSVYGVYSQISKLSLGSVYGGYFNTINQNPTTTNPVYGINIRCETQSTSNAVYGVYANVTETPPGTGNIWSGYFMGGRMYVSGYLGIGTHPTEMLDVAGTTKTVGLIAAGNVGIGVTNPTVKLDVAGDIRAHRLKVCLNQGCDYVFEEDYKLMSLSNLNDFVKTNKHLPDVAPAAQMEAEGIDVSEMNALLLKKVEELTLYVIELKNEIENLKKSEE